MIKLAVAIIQDPESRRLLLQHRDGKAPTEPNRWGMFGGSIEDGESPEEAMIRELHEEIGPVAASVHPRLVREYLAESGKYRYVFLIELPMTAQIVLGEGQGYEWIHPEDVFSYELSAMTQTDLIHFLKIKS
jgi:8-oxo-dGTP diphosphatase